MRPEGAWSVPTWPQPMGGATGTVAVAAGATGATGLILTDRGISSQCLFQLHEFLKAKKITFINFRLPITQVQWLSNQMLAEQ